ncbi:hypothetical protein FDK38_000853 [Candidozyma auris]|nr:hypothetical protein FDK38_000853 [[Candida] auris]
MSSVPKQDLALFSDHSILPDGFLKADHPQLGTIGSVQGTSPAWLLSSFIENAIVGTASTTNRDINVKIPNRAHVIYISFSTTKSFVVNACRKNGLSLESDKNFTFLDCFTDLFTKHISDPSKSKKSIDKLFNNLSLEVENVTKEPKMVILENPEILLAATDLTSNELIYFLVSLQAVSNSMFVVIGAEPSFIDFGATLSDSVVSKYTDFYVKLFHKSSINLNLSPLSTGRAEDITGCLTISRGSLPSPIPVAQKDFIYNITKEGNVKLYFR